MDKATVRSFSPTLAANRAFALLQDLRVELRDADVRRTNTQDHALWMFAVNRTLSSATDVAVREDVSPELFDEVYYRANRPLKLRRLGEHARAREWSFADLRAQFGDVVVEVMRNRDRRTPEYFDLDRHRTPMKFNAFLDDVESLTTNELYMTAYNRAMAGPLRSIIADYQPLPGLLQDPIDASLWIGPAGALTQLHFDRINVMMVQLIGSKRVTLLPPQDEPFVYHDGAMLAGVDAFAPDLEAHPLYRFATPRVIDLEAGSALFVPVGWWHAVECLVPSLSLSVSAFVNSENFYPPSAL